MNNIYRNSKPKRLFINMTSDRGYECSNCAHSGGKTYILHYNNARFNIYSDKQLFDYEELFFCEGCFKTLQNSIKEVITLSNIHTQCSYCRKSRSVAEGIIKKQEEKELFFCDKFCYEEYKNYRRLGYEI